MFNCRPPVPFRRPEVNARARDMSSLCVELVRVLDDAGEAVGPWNPHLEPSDLQVGLRHMLLTRLYRRSHAAHAARRQNFLLHALAGRGSGRRSRRPWRCVRPTCCFPSYRQQGAANRTRHRAGRSHVQLLSNTRDMCKGRQLPVMYHSRANNIFSISGNLATQFPQAVGWAMAAAIKGEDHWPRPGSARAAAPRRIFITPCCSLPCIRRR